MTPGDFRQPLYQNKVVTWKPIQCLTTVIARCNQSSRTNGFVPRLRGNKTTGQAASFPASWEKALDKRHYSLLWPVCVWTMCIAWLGNVARPNNFHGYGTSQDQRGGLTDPFRGGLWSCLPQTSATQPPHTTYKISSTNAIISN